MGDNRGRYRHCRDRRPVDPTGLRLSDLDAIGAVCVRLRRVVTSCWLIPSQDGRQLLSCLIGAIRRVVSDGMERDQFFECCTVHRAVRVQVSGCCPGTGQWLLSRHRSVVAVPAQVSGCCPGTGIAGIVCVVRRVRSRNNQNIANIAVCALNHCVCGRNWDPTSTETACSCSIRQKQ